jgi:hypothetical protein
MTSVILVMWPQVDQLIDEFGGQSIGAMGIAVFPGSKKQAIRSRLNQHSSSADVTVLELTGLGSFKVGMTSPMPDGAQDVIDQAFPSAGNFF